MRRALPGVFAVLLAAAAAAQDTRSVPVTVTAVSARSVYLDKGRNDGIVPGTIVRLLAAGAGQIEIEVRAVSASSARAELQPGQVEPPVGTRGEAEVASPPAQDAPKPTPRVAHPGWTRQETTRAPDQPLLVPAFRQRPDQRPADVRGRLVGQFDWNHAGNGEGDSDYALGRVSTWMEGSNVLGVGDRTRFAGELSARRAWLPDAADTGDEAARLDLLSVAVGTEDWAPRGLEAGRFLSEHLPELGLVDGVEGVVRFDGGFRAGLGLGAYPRPFPARDTGEDVGVHVFGDYVSDPQRRFAAGLGLQKTWHEGAPDRDLVLLRVEARPGGGFSVYSTAKFDVYGSGDTRKASGVEVTEFLAQIRWDGARAGLGATASRFRWPDLKRREYQDLPDALVRDGRVDRLSLSAHVRPWSPLRLSGRVDAWRDQARDGTAWDLGGDWTDVRGSGTALSVAVFRSEGSYNSGPGARVRLRRRFGDVDASVAWNWHRYRVEGLIGGDETLTRQSVGLGFDWSAGPFDWSLSAEHWFGDREDAYAVFLFTQLRF